MISADLLEPLAQASAALGVSQNEFIEQAIKEKIKLGKKTSYPDDFTITTQMITWFESKGFDFDMFTATDDWAASMRSKPRRYRYSDWAKAWQNGMIKHASFRSKPKRQDPFERLRSGRGSQIIEKAQRIRQSRTFG